MLIVRGEKERERESVIGDLIIRIPAACIVALRLYTVESCRSRPGPGASERDGRAVGASERLDAVRGRAGRFYTSETFPPRSFSWFARTRVMSPCLFDPLSRILMMVQMSRRTGAILSCEFRPDARPPTLGPRPPLATYSRGRASTGFSAFVSPRGQVKNFFLVIGGN